MTTTYTYINKVQLASPASSITFSSIPATFKDLVIRFNARSDAAFSNQQLQHRFNGDSASNYWWMLARGTGGDASTNFGPSNTANGYGGLYIADSQTANFFATGEFYICDYTIASGKITSYYQTVSSNDNNPSYMNYTANIYSASAPISSIQLFTPGQNFMARSTFYLYGISNS